MVLCTCLIIIGLAQRLNKTESVKLIKTPSPERTESTVAKVTKVFDGDTIEISDGVKVRYIGIDAPEVYPESECFSIEAKKENERLVLGKEIGMLKDKSETDKYGRLLRYVYTGDVMVNEALVKSGFARVMNVPPDDKYKDLILISEKFARENKNGLWSKCF